MKRETFSEHLSRATADALRTGRKYLEEPLPDEVRFRLRLNSSYDIHADPEKERLYPEDSSYDRHRSLQQATHDEVVALLHRDGRVPVWIDAAVSGKSERTTLVKLTVAGRFTDDEAREFLGRAIRAPVRDDVGAAIQRRMDGWAAGLRLAAIAVRESDDPNAPLRALVSRTSSHVLPYVLDEIVRQQHPDLRQFLQRTSLPDRFCPPLADALMDWTDGGLSSVRALEHLRELGLFVSTAGDRRDWYRYHDLLREALQHDLRLHESAEAIRSAAIDTGGAETAASTNSNASAKRRTLAPASRYAKR